MLTPHLTGATWRKSTRSNGATNCVEIAAGHTWVASWRKSSRSSGASNCVEVADGPGWVAVRDSKDPSGPVLAVTRESFRTFVAGTRAGMFDSAGHVA